MVKIRLGTTISLLVHLFLTFWLVNQYLNDIYFQNYVNASIGPYSPFIVLTIGLGGGSGFGYILLKRRHGDQGLIGKIQKSKSFKPTSSPFQPTTQSQPGSTMRQPPEPPMRQVPSPAWNPPPSAMNEGRSDSGPVFQKPGLDTSARQGVPFPSAPGQQQSSQSSPVPSKWGPPDRPAIGPSSDTGGVRSIPPLPTKWSPPSGSSNPQGSPPPQGIPRPGPMPMRPSTPPTQGGPRPFVIQGPGRPGEQRPMAPPRPFGAGPPPRPPGMGTQPGLGQSAPRPSAPLGGPMPMPQPWKPPTQTPDKESSDSTERGDSLTELSSASPGTESKSPPAAGGPGEMDWDTALDTILKTLRKDRGVGESK